MSHWQPTATDVWQGRNDLAESPEALRLFQVVGQQDEPRPVVLLGFACDEGVKRNHGRIGAAAAPDALRKMLANLAAHVGHHHLTDGGTLMVGETPLEEAQETFSQGVTAYQQRGVRTLVFGGGHETAFAHGLGIYRAHPNKTVGIINFDAHLDLRRNDVATSGTPFRELARHCEQHQKPFHYLCVGASLAANTQALVNEAHRLKVEIVWDTDALTRTLDDLCDQIRTFMGKCEIVYLTVDLDVLPAWQMPGVSAPAAVGLPIERLLPLIGTICESPSLWGADLVEYNPSLDPLQSGARTAARIAWQILHQWNIGERP